MGKRGEDARAAIAGLAEILTTLTTQMRMAPDDQRVKRIDTQGAAKALLAYYTDKPLVGGGGGGNLTINAILGSLPPGTATALFRAMALASGRQPAGLLGTGQ